MASTMSGHDGINDVGSWWHQQCWVTMASTMSGCVFTEYLLLRFTPKTPHYYILYVLALPTVCPFYYCCTTCHVYRSISDPTLFTYKHFLSFKAYFVTQVYILIQAQSTLSDRCSVDYLFFHHIMHTWENMVSKLSKLCIHNYNVNVSISDYWICRFADTHKLSHVITFHFRSNSFHFRVIAVYQLQCLLIVLKC